jgi:hypothetical protein
MVREGHEVHAATLQGLVDLLRFIIGFPAEALKKRDVALP